jgi:Acyltransferase family
MAYARSPCLHLAFHLGLAGSRGGFVGVDVFFVISGFVITHGVLLELDEQRFSLQAFYLRRARRILPALIVTLLVGSIVLSPSETREFAGSALASSVSAANVFFTTAPTTLPTPPTTGRSCIPGRSAWKSSSICCSRCSWACLSCARGRLRRASWPILWPCRWPGAWWWAAWPCWTDRKPRPG